jgi:serine kinase of HPr protein (carbohydrate metabolism regulator)
LIANAEESAIKVSLVLATNAISPIKIIAVAIITKKIPLLTLYIKTVTASYTLNKYLQESISESPKGFH